MLLLVAGQAVAAAVLLHEAAGADGLLAAAAGEAGLVPAGALVLHLLGAWLKQRERETPEGPSERLQFGSPPPPPAASWRVEVDEGRSEPRPTWHDGLGAGVAPGRVLAAVALHTHQQAVLGGEGLLHQGAAALDAGEALAVPVALLEGQVLETDRVRTGASAGPQRSKVGLTLLVQPMSSWQTSHLLENRAS